MKCPKCWAEKAYVRQVDGWKGLLTAWLLLVPLKCHHCFHTFVVSRFSTFGKQTKRLTMRSSVVRRSAGPSCAARHYWASLQNTQPNDAQTAKGSSCRVDAG